jgi:uncharacterized lipoprotein YddW (UPF0748 family)
MNKREFLQALGLGGLGLAVRNLNPEWAPRVTAKSHLARKHWAWVATDLRSSTDLWKKRFAEIRTAGVSAILPEVYDSHKAYYQSRHLPVGQLWLEEILPLAAAEGLETHAWMWSVPCNVEEIRTRHPEWFVVNRKGESAAEKPAYVDYYRFLCPSHPEVHEYLKTTVSELSGFDGLAGVHLDYIRYPDVILPEALQPKYGLKQDGEYPEFDYCYCDLCRRDFKLQSGIDPVKMTDPTGNKEWRQFRYDRITRLVNETLVPAAHAQKKVVTAAVFPNWENVRQQWPVWKVDAVLPMLYHTLYKKGPEWIRQETEKCVRSLKGRIPLYAGILIFQLTQDALASALEAALAGGAGGIVIFHATGMSEAHWETFRRVTDRG